LKRLDLPFYLSYQSYTSGTKREQIWIGVFEAENTRIDREGAAAIGIPRVFEPRTQDTEIGKTTDVILSYAKGRAEKKISVAEKERDRTSEIPRTFIPTRRALCEWESPFPFIDGPDS